MQSPSESQREGDSEASEQFRATARWAVQDLKPDVFVELMMLLRPDPEVYENVVEEEENLEEYSDDESERDEEDEDEGDAEAGGGGEEGEGNEQDT